MTLSEDQNSTLNFGFRANISTYWAKNTFKSEPFKAKNIALLTSEQLQNNFPKVQKIRFGLKKGRNKGTNFAKSVDF